MTTQTRLDAYLAAELAILQAQEVSSEGRAQKMAALADVRVQIDKLTAQVNRETAAAAGLIQAMKASTGFFIRIRRTGWRRNNSARRCRQRMRPHG